MSYSTLPAATGSAPRYNPMVQPSGLLRRPLLLGLGRVLINALPGWSEQLRRGELGDEMPGLATRAAVAAIVSRELRAGRARQLTGLHDWLWRGDSQSLAYHERTLGRFQSHFLVHHAELVPELRRMMAARPADFHTLCELGCGTGLLLEHLHGKLPKVRRWVGLDRSVAQTAANRAHFEGSELQFSAGDLRAWVPENVAAGWVLLTNGGVLEYLAEAAVREFASHIARCCRPAALAVIEPLAAEHDLDRDADSRPYGQEHTFSHNYVDVFAKAGMRVVYRRDMMIGAQRWFLLLAVTP